MAEVRMNISGPNAHEECQTELVLRLDRVGSDDGVIIEMRGFEGGRVAFRTSHLDNVIAALTTLRGHLAQAGGEDRR